MLRSNELEHFKERSLIVMVLQIHPPTLFAANVAQ